MSELLNQQQKERSIVRMSLKFNANLLTESVVSKQRLLRTGFTVVLIIYLHTESLRFAQTKMGFCTRNGNICWMLSAIS
ncbi:hypothetical protein Zmor_005514 [Zophobas morio]|uniref:Uncharacterized protein n=1 Tax=Zophobas morio TaxID=2755281 RepID=A0AA38ITJ3_9CUCU|nr:hypothetical protein Zmor_005514 [Zophobas morio]